VAFQFQRAAKFADSVAGKGNIVASARILEMIIARSLAAVGSMR
jgi:hypothetical protein